LRRPCRVASVSPVVRQRWRVVARAAAAALAWVAIGVCPLDAIHLKTASMVDLPEPPKQEWRLIEGKQWQIVSTDIEDVATTDAREGTRGNCPPGMVEVSGRMKADGPLGTVEDLQKQACSVWINRNYPERCGVFDADRWRSLSRDLPLRPMHFCVDRFEYPNQKGSYPVVVVTWHEAAALCKERGERLCTEDEWTFACEGEEALPFATGYLRDPSTCVLDRPWRFVHEEVLAERTSARALRAIDELWQGEASGAYPRCRSPFGVYDTIGNVDEWTRSTQKSGLRSILKGGYWGPVRTWCRATTRVHDEDFYFYQIGFRCCADAPRAREEETPK
jgi:Sulfatase-modifying factor enzyme 1